MKHVVLALVLSGCAPELTPLPAGQCGALQGGEGALGPIAPGTALVLTTSYAFDSSSLDVVPLGEPTALALDRAQAEGDAALRRVGEQAVIINRGNASNLLLIDGEGYPSRQIALGDCGPHDVELVEGCRALVTCYDADAPVIVDLSSGDVTPGPSLAELADDDGLPEMDQMIRVGDRIFVTLQRLDRVTYAPTGPSLVAVIDAATLTLTDVDPSTAGVQGYEICVNPYTDLGLMPDGRIVVACAGDFFDASNFALWSLAPDSGATTVLADGAALGGAPSALRVDAAGAAYAVVSSPNGYEATEMRVVRVEGATSTIVYRRDGFSLGGLAVDGDGNAYVADRSLTDSAGVWIVDSAGVASGPIRTGQPPYEIEVF